MEIQEFKTLVADIYTDLIDSVGIVQQIFIDQFGIDNIDLRVESAEQLANRLLGASLDELGTSIINLTVISDYEVEHCTLEDVLPSIEANEHTYTFIKERISNRIRPLIIVRFPEVKVTNENDDSITIQDLFVKVKLSKEGKLQGTFSMIRSTYTTDQWKVGYSHSHIKRLTDYCPYWADPCLGSGPIRRTIGTLQLGFNEDIWRLFVYELSLYVQVESLQGTPWIRMQEVTGNVRYAAMEGIPDRVIYVEPVDYYYGITSREFVLKLMQYIFTNRILDFRFINNSYTIANSRKEIVMRISNAFIEVLNQNRSLIHATDEELFHDCILNKCVWKDDSFKKILNSTGRTERHNEGKGVVRFKGKFFPLKLIESPSVETEYRIYTILDYSITSRYVTFIINKINSYYGNNRTYATNNIVI